MTEKEKSKIIKLRKMGFGYGQISEQLNIPRSSVSSFCNRNKIDIENSERFVFCKCCSKVIKLVSKVKPKVFCSDSCRVKWWNSNQDKEKKKAIYEFVCPVCNKHFTAYGKKYQKYCSHACYISNRYGR